MFPARTEISSSFFFFSSFFSRSRVDSVLSNCLPARASRACHSYSKYTAYWTKIIPPPRKPLPGLTRSYSGKPGEGQGGELWGDRKQ